LYLTRTDTDTESVCVFKHTRISYNNARYKVTSVLTYGISVFRTFLSLFTQFVYKTN